MILRLERQEFISIRSTDRKDIYKEKKEKEIRLKDCLSTLNPII